jgi:hypothetical protein
VNGLIEWFCPSKVALEIAQPARLNGKKLKARGFDTAFSGLIQESQLDLT